MSLTPASAGMLWQRSVSRDLGHVPPPPARETISMKTRVSAAFPSGFQACMPITSPCPQPWSSSPNLPSSAISPTQLSRNWLWHRPPSPGPPAPRNPRPTLAAGFSLLGGLGWAGEPGCSLSCESLRLNQWRGQGGRAKTLGVGKRVQRCLHTHAEVGEGRPRCHAPSLPVNLTSSCRHHCHTNDKHREVKRLAPDCTAG